MLPVDGPGSDSDALRQGDERAAAGDWVAAVAHWRTAGGADAAAAAERLADFLASLGQPVEGWQGDGRRRPGFPPGTTGLLKLGLAATALSVAAFAASYHGAAGSDMPLVYIGWLTCLVAAGCILLFAARSGRPAPGPALGPGDLRDLADRAATEAVRLKPTPSGEATPAGQPGSGRRRTGR